jgi:murein DD-endopeptidase MepM/ murein hydrolase activator NlpD
MAELRAGTQGRNDATTESSSLCVFASLRLSAASLRLSAVLLLAACASPTDSAVPDSPAFASPIVGRPLEELFYGAYLDQGGRDYNCGGKYYARHRGTDILLRNFRVQDSGVTVVAAAAGEVSVVHDGEPDRNGTQDSNNDWNVVYIVHPGGITSIYGHLRRGSIVVTPGQTVTAGTPLGLVGSSGFSNWPHLHFEVRRGSTAIDPWRGPCQPGLSLWQAQLPYQNAFRVLDAGVRDGPVGGQPELLERPPDSPTITGAGGVLSFWVELYNIRAELLRAELRNPAGTVVQSVDNQNFLTFSAVFALATYPLTPDLPPGKWRAVFLMRALGSPVTVEVSSVEFTLGPGVALRSGGTRSAQHPTLQVFTPGGDTR